MIGSLPPKLDILDAAEASTTTADGNMREPDKQMPTKVAAKKK
jgi:hypothetical protein